MSLAIAVPNLVSAARRRSWSFEMSLVQRARVLLRFGLSGLGYLVIVVAGILFLASSFSAAFNLLLVTIVGLLVISLRNTWDLLVTVADVTPEGD